MTFPSWRYGPGGQAQIFQSEADVPKGWFDHPSKLPPPPLTANTGLLNTFALPPHNPFDHDGDGKPGGSLPKKRGRPRKAK